LGKVYYRRWASSRGLFDEKTEIFNELDETELEHLYTDLPAAVYDEVNEERFLSLPKENRADFKPLKRSEPLPFELTDSDGNHYQAYYYPPLFRKWAMDATMVDYFRDKFNFQLN
jgi:hypothetical protein